MLEWLPSACKSKQNGAMAKLKVGKTVESLGDYLREQRSLAQMSLRQLAEQSDVSNPYLSQIERGLRRPSAEVLQQIARALKISVESLYVKAGILDASEVEEGSVEHAIARDARLTDRQRRLRWVHFHRGVLLQ